MKCVPGSLVHKLGYAILFLPVLPDSELPQEIHDLLEEAGLADQYAGVAFGYSRR